MSTERIATYDGASAAERARAVNRVSAYLEEDRATQALYVHRVAAHGVADLRWSMGCAECEALLAAVRRASDRVG